MKPTTTCTTEYRPLTTATKPKKKRQILPKEQRRQQLIEATIRCIARDGLAAVTMHMVTQEAGLSLGIANLHFETKDNLLKETLRSVAEEYHGGQIAIMEGRRTEGLADRLASLLAFQLGRGVTQRQKMAVWFAYYGEAGARPVYQKIVSASDRMAAMKLESLFTDIIEEGQYKDANAAEIAMGYSALIDGLHLALLVTPREISKREARVIARNFLHRAFPQHI